MKTIRSFFRKHRNGGFTLVEMIVAVAVLAILLVGMMITISPVINSFNDNSRDIVATNISTCIDEYVNVSTRNAASILIFANTSEDEVKNSRSTQIDRLKALCNKMSTTNRNLFELKCISFRYDAADDRYYMYKEDVPYNKPDMFNESSRKNVFSKCFYNDLYYDISMEKALDMDKADQTPQPRLGSTISTVINTYSDVGHNNLVFSGSGLTEYREIKRQIYISEKKGQTAQYFCEIYNGSESAATTGFSTADATDDMSRDVFIYYIVYNFDASKDTK